MSVPRLGYLCLSENPTHEYGRALIRQFVLVREADRMGYDDIWVGEQHDDPAWPMGGIAALLGHLAAVTSKARIGALPLLPLLHDPARLAEELATVDLLSKGRFELGVASGAAFPALLGTQGTAPSDAPALLRARLAELLPLLAGEASPAGLAPRVPQAQQRPVPVWLAADDEASLRLAGERGWGLVAAATHTLERVQRARALYMAASGGRAPELVLARFACSADSADEARAIAEPYLTALAARGLAAGWGADRARSLLRDTPALLADSLVGRHADVARQFGALAESHGATRVAIVPTCAQFDTHKHILAAFVDEVRPLLED